MIILIAHAAWDERRQVGRARLYEQHPSAIVVSSEKREHASVWAPRLWRRALETKDPWPVFLNDDVTTAPAQAIAAMIDALPEECEAVSLATIQKEASADVRWLRSYCATGPGYAVSRDVLQSLIDFYESLPEPMRMRMNEDEVIAHWAWSRQRPLWQCVPALVRHHTDIPSTLGFDNHPMRVSPVLWDETNVDVCAPWPDACEPLYVPHPWMGEGRMRIVRAALTGGSIEAEICAWCRERMILITSPHTGLGMCGQCLTDAVGHILTNARVG